ncbi:P27 family phage terminase small subunit [Flagellatimonas centrodinii]|uniref:P27 family phage terminase small subunit n=1 Tax=Flagellatimonas centrodinii TaxID=2806210 RepID=UPI001FF05E52|nr:P27 family phage terminase small subunit [Flagellatimonas centrodinii]ULQ45859.1 P27 family phage terminase small subunit [Flagellatimonas centrodinii]
MGLRGPKPMPSHLRLVTGNAGRRPVNEDEPQFDIEAPECPEYLSDDARAEWDVIVPDLVAARLVSKVDRMAVAGYCEAVSLWKRSLLKIQQLADEDPDGQGLVVKGPNGFAMFSQWLNIRNRAYGDMMKAIASLGLSPADRARVKALDNGQGMLFPDDPMEAMLRAGEKAAK